MTSINLAVQFEFVTDCLHAGWTTPIETKQKYAERFDSNEFFSNVCRMYFDFIAIQDERVPPEFKLYLGIGYRWLAKYLDRELDQFTNYYEVAEFMTEAHIMLHDYQGSQFTARDVWNRLPNALFSGNEWAVMNGQDES